MEHGLGLPQYRAAFVANGVTVADFPLLLQQPAILADELGVPSPLHRRQIERAIHAVVLGLGDAPVCPTGVCHAPAGAAGGIVVAWDAPTEVRSIELRTRLRCKIIVRVADLRGSGIEQARGA